MPTKTAKLKRVSTNILIDEICPNLTCVYYPDGTHKIVRGAITLEDFNNRQAENRWYQSQLVANRGNIGRTEICQRGKDAGKRA
jgi:hypothetical protein